MTQARRRKIMILLFSMSLLSIVVALVLYALRQNISLFYTPSQVAAGEAPQQHTIRLGGMVEQGSIVRSKKSLAVQFKITDFNQKITVIYTGILPDLFREGQGVVTEGQLIDNQHFRASQVLAKHDANYMPPEVKAALSKQIATTSTSASQTLAAKQPSSFEANTSQEHNINSPSSALRAPYPSAREEGKNEGVLWEGAYDR